MALTVADLLRTPGLDVRPVAGAAGGRARIRWVHVSELDDPTPWLKGGELLLTTGMGVGKTAAAQRAYVKRLADAGLAGLGFGTGFSFRSVPKPLADAAERASFPVFEVPYAVPFIAITEVVFTRLVAEQYDVLSRSLEAEHTLTRAVLDGEGVDGILRALRHATGGWTVLFDLHGALLAAEPTSADVYLPRLWSELQTPRAEGQRFSLSVVDHGQHIALQPVAAQGRVEAYLAVGKPDALSQFDRIVSSHALALLALELAKARAVSETERRLKGDLLDKLLEGDLDADHARQGLERLGFDTASPLAAVALADGRPPAELLEACEGALGAGGNGSSGPAAGEPAFLLSSRDDLVLLVIQPGDAASVGRLRAAVSARVGHDVLAGAGSAVPVDQLLQSVREARYALQVCRTDARQEARFEDLGTYQLLLSLQEPDALRTFADSVLAPLDAYDRAQGGELVTSLRAFLDRNARWESAAKDLLVHRHTLRYRMRKVEELTGRRLTSARDRMEFFLALRARDLLASNAAGRTG